ncbi:hypothetical protein [Herbaspirillum huttiense]|uniref:hypothetical protein n=1 Tax=Herbaspirillum huttiense TaxID=863372 RepID=UPI0031DDC8DC
MKIPGKILSFLGGATAASLLFCGYLVWKPATVKIHRLAAPLQLGTKEASNGLLPVGTTLYYDTSFTDEQIEVMFFADEACVESRSLRLDQGKWLLYGLGAGCD